MSVSHSTLCDSMDYSPPGSSVHGILQARILEWVAISSSGDLPDPGIEPGSSSLQADSLPSEPPGKPINEDRLKGKSKALFDQLCQACPTEQSDSEMEE